MLKIWKILLQICILVVATIEANCQEEKLKVGEQVPNFIFNDIDHYTRAEASMEDFRGKWLIMDFWTRNCPACVWGFPKINELQKEFNNDVNFLLVGINDQYGWQIKSFYAGVRVAQRLKLPVAYDSMLWRKFGFITVPHLVIINREGKIKDITPSNTFDRERLKQLLQDENK